jgi:hypothetical protein
MISLIYVCEFSSDIQHATCLIPAEIQAQYLCVRTAYGIAITYIYEHYICGRETEREICLLIDSYFCSAITMCTLNGLSGSEIMYYMNAHIFQRHYLQLLIYCSLYCLFITDKYLNVTHYIESEITFTSVSSNISHAKKNSSVKSFTS